MRNRVLMVSIGVAVLGLCVYGTVSAFHILAASETPAKAVNAGLVSSISNSARVVSSGVPGKQSSTAPSKPASSAPVSVPPDSEPPASSHGAVSLPSGRTVYLTFDDGPSSLTGPLLDVLDRYQVKATFFVVGVNDKNETNDLKEIVRRGHAIGVHSWTHNYHQIYASADAFFADYDRMHQAIFNATGVDTKICRFPGGSVNGYDKKTRAAILKEMKQRGIVYFDWNAGGGDAGGAKTSEAIYNNAMQGVRMHHVSVVLFHNTSAKGATLRQVPQFISTLKSQGYKFAVLSPSVDNRPFIF